MSNSVNQAPKAKNWLTITILLSLLIGATGLMLAWPLEDFISGRGTPQQKIVRAGEFFTLLGHDPARVFKLYGVWFSRTLASTGLPPLTWLTGVVPALGILLFGLSRNPYKFSDTTHGDATVATKDDLKEWAREKPSKGLLDKAGIVLGRWKEPLPVILLMSVLTLRLGWKGPLLRRFETLALLVLAAPGSGKTTGIVMPTILSDGNDAFSMFVFDIKGELFEKTSGWRAKFGPVFRFEPKGRTGARWNPLSPWKSLPGGQEYFDVQARISVKIASIYGEGEASVQAKVELFNLIRTNHEWVDTIRANPALLSPLQVSPDEARMLFGELSSGDPGKNPSLFDDAKTLSMIQADRETYLLVLGNGMIPEPAGGGGGNAKHFSDTGRAALLGMMGFTISRAELLGIEPNFGLLLDYWLGDAEKYGANLEGGGGEDDDAIGAMLDGWILECVQHGYPDRYRKELVELKNKPGRERGSVVSTASNALNIFKTATVRDRTATSDFSLDEIRGMPDKNGVSRPVTVYVVVNLESIKSMAPILMMFTESLMARLVSQPAKVAEKSRKVLFLLDEFAQLPKMPLLLSTPAVGRGQGVGTILIAQSEGQIKQTYGQDGLSELKDTTEWKGILPLNDPATAKGYSDAIGNTTIYQENESRTTGAWLSGLTGIFSMQQGGGRDPLERNIQGSKSGIPLFSTADLMSTGRGAKLKADEMVVLQYKKFNRPIICQIPFFFKDKKLLNRAKIAPPDYDTAKGFCGPMAKLAPAKEEKAQDAVEAAVAAPRASLRGPAIEDQEAA